MSKFSKGKIVGIVAATSMLVGLVGVTASAQDTQTDQDSAAAAQSQQQAQPSAQSKKNWNPLLRAYALHEIKFDLGDGTAPTASGHEHDLDETAVEPDGTLTLPTTKPTPKSGWEFTGWTVTTPDTPDRNGKSYQPGGQVKNVQGDLVLKAQYRKLPVPSSGSGSTNPSYPGYPGYPGETNPSGPPTYGPVPTVTAPHNHPGMWECTTDPGAHPNTDVSGQHLYWDWMLGYWNLSKQTDTGKYLGFWSNVGENYMNNSRVQSGVSPFGCTALYKVTFTDAKNGTSVESLVHSGDKVTKPNDPAPVAGYRFRGWYLDGEKFDFDTPITDNTNLTASWVRPVNFKMSFDLQVQPGEDPVNHADRYDTQTVNIETDNPDPSKVSHDFYVPSFDPWRPASSADHVWLFKGWRATYPDKTGQTSSSDTPSAPRYGDRITLTENNPTVVLTAQWKLIDSYNLSFNLNVNPGEDSVSNPEQYARQSVKYDGSNHTFTLPENPKRPSSSNSVWVFDGWNLRESGDSGSWQPNGIYGVGKQFRYHTVDLSTGYNNAQLTARWKRMDNYQLSFDANVPSSAHGAQATASDTAKTVWAPWTGDQRVFALDGTEKLSLDGYEFLGWSAAKNASTPDYKAGDAKRITVVKPKDATMSTQMTLYGVWARERTHTLKLDYNAGGDTSLQASCSKDEDGEPVAGDESCTLPATDTSVTDTEDSSDISVPQSGLMRDGATFVGWNRSADGSGATIQPGDSVAVGADSSADEANAQDSTVTLYAQWIPKSVYSVSFAPGDGHVTTGFDTLTATTSRDSKKFVIPAANRYGDDENGTHRFTGWKDEGSGKSYQPGDTVVVASTDRNVVLTAQWDNIYPYTLHIVTNHDGAKMDTPLDDVTNPTTDDTATLKVPTDYTPGMKDDSGRYEFAGWQDESGKTYQPGESVTLAKNHTSVTLTAQWNKIYDYHLSFDMNAGDDTVSPGRVASMDKSTTDKDYRFEMPNVLPTRVSADSSYTWQFVGWNTARDGSGTSPVAGLGGQPALTLQGAKPSVVLYAQWAKVVVPSVQLPSTSSTVVKPSSPSAPLAPVATPVTPTLIVPSMQKPTEPSETGQTAQPTSTDQTQSAGTSTTAQAPQSVEAQSVNPVAPQSARTAQPQSATGRVASSAAPRAAQPSAPSSVVQDHSVAESNPGANAKPRIYCLADGQGGTEVSGSVYVVTSAGYMVRAAGQVGSCVSEAASASYTGTRTQPLWWLLAMALMFMIVVVLIRHRNRFLYAQHRCEQEG